MHLKSFLRGKPFGSFHCLCLQQEFQGQESAHRESFQQH